MINNQWKLQGDGSLAEIVSNEQLTVWMETYKDLVYRIAMVQVKQPTLADDIFQEVFMRLVQDGHKLVGEDEAHIKNWLIRTTYHRCYDYFRKTARSKIVDFNDALSKEDFVEALEPHSLLPCDEPTEEMKEDVYQAVLSLPEDMRIVILLYYYQEMSVHEIASVLDLKENAVKTRMCRARKRLKKPLERWKSA